ncbi:uncharacterized protein LOC112508654 [Cynara cardunculus var. scolymus]|uniref:uncharacterized protein LOC112508654 n=1 Tax=Cynara cardunculus var. scolymus TaxID=59895 RepID=UPI000D62DF95|nr:uncharacterized protein LOC112508654 [Cynara cardunculus var. scolymus]
MDFKLGLKLKQVSDELDVLISKAESVDPLFTTQQTDSMFILTSHLKGYARSDIKIEINEDGSRITVSGEKPVQETLMVECEVVKKRVEMRGFRKTFKIPEGVVLDKVRARLDEDESRLVIRMPKAVHGIVGIGIQELEEIPKQDDDHDEMRKVDEQIVGSKGELKQEEQVTRNDKDTNEVKPDNEIHQESRQVHKIEEEINHDIEDKVEEEINHDIEEKKPVAGERSSIICTPIIAGSALLASLIVVVLSLIRSKNESNKKTN